MDIGEASRPYEQIRDYITMEQKPSPESATPSSALLMLANGVDTTGPPRKLTGTYALFLMDWHYDTDTMGQEARGKAARNSTSMPLKEDKDKALKGWITHAPDHRRGVQSEIALEELKKYLQRQPGAVGHAENVEKRSELKGKPGRACGINSLDHASRYWMSPGIACKGASFQCADCCYERYNVNEMRNQSQKVRRMGNVSENWKDVKKVLKTFEHLEKKGKTRLFRH